jgi:high frequency lysogenization protein
MTETDNAQDQVIALAGVAQAARIVDQVARTGTWPEPFLEASIHSLFTFEPPDVASVYGNLQGVKLGLQNLAACLANRPDEATGATMKYFMAILKLEREFSRRSDLQEIVHSRLQHTHYKATHFTRQTNEVCASIAGIYEDTLSTLNFRVKVTGSAQHLANERNAEVVRALLMAGVRAAHLWRQLGGSRWRLLLSRGKTRAIALELSRELGIR